MATVEQEVIASIQQHRGPTGQSGAIQQIQSLIAQVAGHESSVLILGESGTGKEVVARAIHHASPRRNRPFIAVNCGAIPADLLESELFGHEKGAFTGAVATRKGRFELAEGGTLFLDEIGDMSLSMQVKLLRVLQERVFERVGSALQYKCNVRIVAATHRNLEEAITRGQFREDLFYRLNVFPIEMPALRARIEDLPTLIRDFADLNAAAGRQRVQLSATALECLTRYSWPGNVRELGNLIERLSILCAGRLVGAADLPPRYRPRDWMPAPEADRVPAVLPEPVFAQAEPVALVIAEPMVQRQESELTERDALLLLEDEPAMPGMKLPPEGLDLRAHVGAIEESLIRQALERSGGIVAQAARLLGLRRTTLVEKLRKFDIGGVDESSED
ncbi:MAG TPA: sigma-54 dependent transcriptional regulator [Steroidobacteraceae bacterium]|nr:sigma-54 dependent transcriptional regulator [Steroidobacteraceae bacterium]